MFLMAHATATQLLGPAAGPAGQQQQQRAVQLECASIPGACVLPDSPGSLPSLCCALDPATGQLRIYSIQGAAEQPGKRARRHRSTQPLPATHLVAHVAAAPAAPPPRPPASPASAAHAVLAGIARLSLRGASGAAPPAARVACACVGAEHDGPHLAEPQGSPGSTGAAGAGVVDSFLQLGQVRAVGVSVLILGGGAGACAPLQ